MIYGALRLRKEYFQTTYNFQKTIENKTLKIQNQKEEIQLKFEDIKLFTFDILEIINDIEHRDKKQYEGTLFVMNNKGELYLDLKANNPKKEKIKNDMQWLSDYFTEYVTS